VAAVGSRENRRLALQLIPKSLDARRLLAMRYLVLVTDYDGTVATGGQAETVALQAIERLRMSGRRAILLTGRRVDDL
jgi:hypothetical protein